MLLQEHPIDLELGRKYFRVSNDKLIGRQLGFRIQSKDLNSPTFLKWLSVQNNLSDSIRYLIEQEILANGVRNLAKLIPSDRDLEEQLDERRKTENTIVKSSRVPQEEIKLKPAQADDIEDTDVILENNEEVVAEIVAEPVNINQPINTTETTQNDEQQSDEAKDNNDSPEEPTSLQKPLSSQESTSEKIDEVKKEEEEVVPGWDY